MCVGVGVCFVYVYLSCYLLMLNAKHQQRRGGVFRPDPGYDPGLSEAYLNIPPALPEAVKHL